MATLDGIALTAAALLSAAPLAAQADYEPSWDAATLYAIVDANEWCPGGSVHVDLWSGDYVLLPRPLNADCRPDQPTRRAILRETLGDNDLAGLRAAHTQAVKAGLEREDCRLILSNGGRELLALTGPMWSLVTPEAEGCWSDEALALHRKLFDLFGEKQPMLPSSDREGWRPT